MSGGTSANPLLDRRLSLHFVAVVVAVVAVVAAAAVVTILVGADILVDDIDQVVENSYFYEQRRHSIDVYI